MDLLQEKLRRIELKIQLIEFTMKEIYVLLDAANRQCNGNYCIKMTDDED